MAVREQAEPGVEVEVVLRRRGDGLGTREEVVGQGVRQRPPGGPREDRGVGVKRLVGVVVRGRDGLVPATRHQDPLLLAVVPGQRAARVPPLELHVVGDPPPHAVALGLLGVEHVGEPGAPRASREPGRPPGHEQFAVLGPGVPRAAKVARPLRVVRVGIAAEDAGELEVPELVRVGVGQRGVHDRPELRAVGVGGLVAVEDEYAPRDLRIVRRGRDQREVHGPHPGRGTARWIHGGARREGRLRPAGEGDVVAGAQPRQRVHGGAVGAAAGYRVAMVERRLELAGLPGRRATQEREREQSLRAWRFPPYVSVTSIAAWYRAMRAPASPRAWLGLLSVARRTQPSRWAGCRARAIGR